MPLFNRDYMRRSPKRPKPTRRLPKVFEDVVREKAGVPNEPDENTVSAEPTARRASAHSEDPVPISERPYMRMGFASRRHTSRWRRLRLPIAILLACAAGFFGALAFTGTLDIAENFQQLTDKLKEWSGDSGDSQLESPALVPAAVPARPAESTASVPTAVPTRPAESIALAPTVASTRPAAPLALAPTAISPTTPLPAELWREVRDSVIAVQAVNRIGTGFYYNGVTVTALHVVEESRRRVSVCIQYGFCSEAIVLGRSETHDIAVLEPPPADFEMRQTDTSFVVEQFEEVFTVSYNDVEQDFDVRVGHVSYVDSNTIEHTAYGTAGVVGGPVFNLDGQLIGMTYALGFAYPLSVVDRFVSSVV